MSAYIEFANDAVSDADSVPGKIVFATSDADDNGTPTVAMTIDDGQQVIIPDGKLVLASTAVTSTAAELNILDASAAVAASSNQDSSNGNVTSNNFKITHTLTLNGALSDNSGITEFTVTNDKVLATSIVIASSTLLDITAPREVVSGSFKVGGKNKTGGTLADDSTVVINYIIL